MQMPSELRSLVMRANRLLGAALVEANLIKIDDLEKANERLLEVLALEQARQSTVLGILAYEMKVLREEDALQHIVDNDGAGLVDLRDYEVTDDVKKSIDLGPCWATWSVPFDKEEDFHFVATAYYLSPPVRAFWEKQLDGPILWFGTTLESIADYLEKMGTERASAPTINTRSPFAAAVAAAGASTPPFPKPKSSPPFGSGAGGVTQAPFAIPVAAGSGSRPPVAVPGTNPPVPPRAP